MDGKKISFGFSKLTKKPALLPSKNLKQDDSSKVELIKCLEGQQIKLVEERKVEAPLVIPLKDGGKTSAALASLAKRRAVLLGEDDEPAAKKSAPGSETQPVNGGQTEEAQSLEKRAENEILAELHATNETTKQVDLVLPVVKPDELPLDGAKEATLDDYESIPIGKYGWAMLRGMGAIEPEKTDQKPPMDNGPMQRPPGLGLGADKAVKSQPLLELPEANEKLEIKKQAFVRILAGKYKDAYGQIEGFDHERGTIVVKLAIGNSKQKFQEFLCQPVSKKEYAQYGKCINKVKYEEYKKLENEHGQIILKKEDSVKTKPEKYEREVRSDVLDGRYEGDYNKRFKSNEVTETSSSRKTERYRSRSRSRSLSRNSKYNSDRRYDHDSFNSRKNARESDSESDSKEEHRKSKSHSSKSRKNKKKHKRRYSSSDEKSSSSSTETDDSNYERNSRHKRSKKKKSKKKTKKSKRPRSRTPTHRRR